MQPSLVLASFAMGALLGYVFTHARVIAAIPWKTMIRIQVLATASLLGFFAAWRLVSFTELWPPFAFEAVTWIALLFAIATRRSRSRGDATMDAWATAPNSGFWVLPLASALLGPAGVTLAALSDRLGALRIAISVHLLRKDAPIKQEAKTAWIDQAPLLAVIAGLFSRELSDAPSWSAPLVQACGPILAVSGGMLFVGSVRLLDRGNKYPQGTGVRRWGALVGLQCVLLAGVSLVFANPTVTGIAILRALSAPPFNPPQLSVLYGYKNATAVASMRYGWILAGVGAVLALLVI